MVHFELRGQHCRPIRIKKSLQRYSHKECCPNDEWHPNLHSCTTIHKWEFQVVLLRLQRGNDRERGKCLILHRCALRVLPQGSINCRTVKSGTAPSRKNDGLLTRNIAIARVAVQFIITVARFHKKNNQETAVASFTASPPPTLIGKFAMVQAVLPSNSNSVCNTTAVPDKPTEHTLAIDNLVYTVSKLCFGSRSLIRAGGDQNTLKEACIGERK